MHGPKTQGFLVGGYAGLIINDRLRVGWLNRFSSPGGVPLEQKMLKGHLPRVIYHQVHKYTKSMLVL